MQRLLIVGCVLCGLAFCAASLAVPGAQPCRYSSRPPAFPDVQRLTVTNGGCTQADHVARSIQRYWQAHSTQSPATTTQSPATTTQSPATTTQSPGAALPARADGFACRYRSRRQPTGDPYYSATCASGETRAHMDLTS